jgi:uncharacterized protein (TIGR02646 family)
MIKIDRIAEEPAGLATARERGLTQLRGMIWRRRRRDLPDTYNRIKPDLHRMQHRKCCYCENIEVPTHNDVEHYRPMSDYPWLGWTWSNLLFACRACNQSGGKLDHFPLADEAGRLTPWAEPPGDEAPLLLDPCADDPRLHIEFVHDAARDRFVPRGRTTRGTETIRLIGLDRDDYLERFAIHVDHEVRPAIARLRERLAGDDRAGVVRTWRDDCLGLLGPTRRFRALSEDALRHFVATYPAPPTALADLR